MTKKAHRTGYKITESSIEEQIKQYLNKMPGCFVQKKHGSVYNRAEPDLTGIISTDKFIGRRIEIEVKTPANPHPTKAQIEKLKKWENLGAITGVAKSVDELKQILIDHDIEFS